jgi:hypothetical protein
MVQVTFPCGIPIRHDEAGWHSWQRMNFRRRGRPSDREGVRFGVHVPNALKVTLRKPCDSKGLSMGARECPESGG